MAVAGLFAPQDAAEYAVQQVNGVRDEFDAIAGDGIGLGDIDGLLDDISAGA